MTAYPVLDSSSEWTSACEIQQRSMESPCPARNGPPRTCVDGSARCRQVHELGGDFYNCLPLSPDRLSIVLGDACGKGLAAALIASNIQSSPGR